MKKTIIYLLIFFLNVYFLISQETDKINIKIIDIKGNVDLRYKEDDWKKPELNTDILEGTEIFTGLHSNISFEIEKGSYITVNQLTHIVFDKKASDKKENKISIYLLNGYVVLHSTDESDKSKKTNSITVLFEQGSVFFSKAGGEVYLRKNRGALIKNYNGKIKVVSKFKTFYKFGKNEMCGLTTDGHIIENDYFLRRNINTISVDIVSEQDITAYFDLIFQPYSLDNGKNDYFDNINP